MVIRSKANSWRGMTIFFSIVIVSGILLLVTGNMENPFTVFPSIVNQVVSGNQNGGQPQDGGQPTGHGPNQGRGGQGRGGQPGTTGTGSTVPSTNGQPPANANGEQGQGQPQGGGQDAIQWNQYGGVLFDLWYIAACTAVVIVISRLIRLFQRRRKQRATPVFSRS